MTPSSNTPATIACCQAVNAAAVAPIITGNHCCTSRTLSGWVNRSFGEKQGCRSLTNLPAFGHLLKSEAKSYATINVA